MELDAQIDLAFTKASEAVTKAKAQHGNQDRGCCGFAWVQIPDGRSKLAKALKTHTKCSKHWQKGLLIWNPGDSNWQNVDVAAAGAYAFAACFPNEAIASSRLD
jgi:hypothetical protein